MRTTGGAHSSPVGGETFGEEIERRRIAVGLDAAVLAREAGIGRTTLHNIVTGVSANPRTAQRTKILRALEAAEAESGVRLVPSEEPTEARTISYTVEGDLGVKVTASGPIEDHELLRNDVVEIVRAIREGTQRQPD